MTNEDGWDEIERFPAIDSAGQLYDVKGRRRYLQFRQLGGKKLRGPMRWSTSDGEELWPVEGDRGDTFEIVGVGTRLRRVRTHR